jgi:membrane associated rhomboid family serine protease
MVMEQRMKAKFKQRVTVLGAICAAMIGVHLIDIPLLGSLKSFGIQPREIGTAWTIATAPFLHADFGHLFGNLSAFIVLAALCLLNGVRYFAKASLIIIGLGGALVWLFGRGSVHIGASGWIFGLWSLAIAQAWYDRSYRNAVIALGVVFVYGGMIYGVLPRQDHVSFEGHFFGALSGIVAAAMLARKQPEQVVLAPRTAELKFWPDEQRDPTRR